MSKHLGYREVTPDQSSFIEWRTIINSTGAAQSTLQDIKVPEYGGSYIYQYTSQITRNRHVAWRVCHDMVELWEDSLDIDFTHNHIQLRFVDSPILEGLSIHETKNEVVILLATVSSVHRISLTHPNIAKGNQENASIFTELTNQTLKDHHSLHVLNSTASGDGLPHTAATDLLEGSSGTMGEAIFVLCQTGGALLVVQMASGPHPSPVTTHVLKNSSLINRLFTGFVPGMFKGTEGSETVVSVGLVYVESDLLVMGMCRDGKIRVWSCQRLDCILSHDCLENTAETGRKMSSAAQRHLLRVHQSENGVYISVFLSFAEKYMLVVYSPILSQGQLVLKHIKTLYPPQYDLVDLMVTSTHIWSLWTDEHNNPQLLYSSIANYSSNNGGMQNAILEDSPEKEVPLSDPTVDAREVYLKEIFAPNRFSALTLRKALGIYRRNLDSYRLNPSNGGSMDKLREEVTITLRDEVEARLTSDMTDEEVAQITLDAWATFYSHTLQYHQVCVKCVGVVNLGGGCVGILKKQCLSWLRPMDSLELATLEGYLDPESVLGEDPTVAGAVLSITKPLDTISAAMEPEIAAAFSLDLLHGHSPDQVAQGVARDLLTGGLGEEGPLGLNQQLCGVGALAGAVQAYLRALQLDLHCPEALASGLPPPHALTVAPWLQDHMGGSLGAGIIASTVAQMAVHRLGLCRDLLLLQHVALAIGGIPPKEAAKIKATLLPQATLLTLGYFALHQLATVAPEIPSQSTLEVTRHQLAALGLGENSADLAVTPEGTCATVLEVFVRTLGGRLAMALVAPDFLSHPHWGDLVGPLAARVAQCAWPISRFLALPMTLVWGGQQAAAQRHVQLLRPWCEWNSCSRKFLLGITLLREGQSRKAARLFVAAAEGVATEDFLAGWVAGGPEGDPRVQYFLRVIRLLEQGGHVAMALYAAQAGVSHAPPGDPGLPALYSVSFKHHLALGHHHEAFTALLACPDHYRRRNCLRQLIVTLYDRKCVDTLVNYQYGSLESEVVTILENRARSADILVNNYYNLLFAFQVKKHNYKKAASVMYECALRLNVEGMGEPGLRQQAKCYLSCLNCLGHIPTDHAWILKPLPKTNDLNDSNDSNDDDTLNKSKSYSKSDMDGWRVPSRCKKAQVEVLEVSDIEREYQLVHARLKIYKAQPDGIQLPSGPMSASDTISLLIHSRLFRDAVTLSRLFQLDVVPVLQGLASVCTVADQATDKLVHWTWLSHNGMTRDSGDNNGWWSLLRNLLVEEEVGGQSHLHQGVVTTLLQRGANLPAWLVCSYKKRNCGELIQLYVNYGLFESGVQLSCEYIDAVLGKGTSEFGLKNDLNSAAPPVWMPYTAFDNLILELTDIKLTPPFGELHTQLKDKIQTYQQELIKVTQDKIILMQR